MKPLKQAPTVTVSLRLLVPDITKAVRLARREGVSVGAWIKRLVLRQLEASK